MSKQSLQEELSNLIKKRDILRIGGRLNIPEINILNSRIRELDSELLNQYQEKNSSKKINKSKKKKSKKSSKKKSKSLKKKSKKFSFLN